jgi:ADP-ribose pyrophosphatase YjhB (NUDIX family)
MNPTQAFKHCLLCGNSLNVEGPRLLVCSKCGHHHYISPNPCNGVIIENEKGEILLVERKVEPKKGYWDFAGGFINPDENLEESCKREIREELSIEIEVTSIVGSYSDIYVYQGVQIPTLGFVVTARIISGTPTPKDDISSYKFFPRDQVLDLPLAFKSVKQGLADYLGSRG